MNYFVIRTFDIQRHQGEEANYCFAFVKYVLHTTLNQHRHELFVRAEHLKQVDVARQKLVFNLVVRDVCKIMNGSIL